MKGTMAATACPATAFVGREMVLKIELAEAVKAVALQASDEQRLITIKQAYEKKPTMEADFTDYQQLLKQIVNSLAPLTVLNLRKVIKNLDIGAEDYAAELELQHLREKATVLARQNREYSQMIDESDVAIGSLIRNIHIAKSRKALEQLRSKSLNATESKAKRVGINEFSKEGTAKLQAYQNLFYVLQTKPIYLARLLVNVNTGLINTIRKSCIHSLFAYSTASRESYLLIRMLSTALELEVKNKVTKPLDITTGSPVVLSLAIDYYRNCSLAYLCTSLKPLILGIINCKHLDLTVDPLVIYKSWIAETELETGTASPLPYVVIAETALEHSEVKDRFVNNIERLINMTNKFLDVICSEEFANEVPFGIRSLSRTLWEALKKKFPATSTKELLKVTANILFYRFIGPMIVSPDMFKMLPSGPGSSISKDARSNLASVHKLLTLAAYGKQTYNFGASLDLGLYGSLQVVSFLKDGYDKFTDFFRVMFDISCPEVEYDMNSMSDEALLNPPQLHITLKEILELHTWVHQYRRDLVNGPNDVLDHVLDQCGLPPSSPTDILGSHADPRQLPVRAAENIHSTVVSLTLMDTKETAFKAVHVPKISMLVRQAIVELIRHRHKCESDLNELLFATITLSEENDYAQAKKVKIQTVSKHVKSKCIMFSPFGETLSTLLDFVRLNLKSVNCVKFDEIAKQIAEDLNTKFENRDKVAFDLDKLRQMVSLLNDKLAYNRETLHCYRQYIDACLAKFSISTSTKSTKKKPSARSIKYTAKELSDRSILLAMDGAEKSQWKQFVFEITPINESDKKKTAFQVKVKYHGLEVFKTNVELMFLLQLKYDGVAIYNLENAKVNVNLLIHLINKKFFAKDAR